MAGFKISVFGAQPLIKLMTGFKGPLAQDVGRGTQQMGMKYQALVMKATPVDLNRLRSSITAQTQGMQTAVGTNVEYASFVEYGTPSGSMQPRHVEGGQTRVLGKGMFTYAMEQFRQGIKNGAKEIAKDIEGRFAMQKLRGFKISKPNLPFF